MPTINFVKEKKKVDVPEGANLRDEAFKAGIEVYWGPYKALHCPGLGMCTNCKMNITKGEDSVSKQGLWEKFWMYFHLMLMNPLPFFSRLGREKQIRSSCQTKVQGDIDVETQPGIDWHGERFWG